MDRNLQNPVSDREDEIGLVDFLAVLVKKRRLWIGILAFGLVLGGIFLALGHFSPELMDVKSRYSFTARAIVLDGNEGQSFAALVTNKASTDIVARKTGKTLGSIYGKNASATFDPVSRIMTIVINARTDEESRILAMAGYDAVLELTQSSGPDLYGKMAAGLEDLAKGLLLDEKPAILDSRQVAAIDSVAGARIARILAETYVRSVAPSGERKDIVSGAYDALIDGYRLVEAAAEEELARIEGSAGTTKASNAAISAIIAKELRKQAGFYRGLKPKEHLHFLDLQPTEPKDFSSKQVLVILFAAFFIAMFAAFAANLWDHIAQDPRAMRKLREAMADGSGKKRPH